MLRKGLVRGFVAALILVLTAACGGDGPITTQDGFVSGDGALTWLPAGERPMAPEISGPDLADPTEQVISLADYRGTIVVLNVWGSWCGPCREEAPDLVAAAEKLGERAQFLGLNTRDLDPAPAQAFGRAFEVSYPNIYDPRGELLLEFSDLPPNGIPSTVVIDAEGKVAARIIGTVTESTLIGLVEDVEAGR